jgi:hypothetical protein
MLSILLYTDTAGGESMPTHYLTAINLHLITGDFSFISMIYLMILSVSQIIQDQMTG